MLIDEYFYSEVKDYYSSTQVRKQKLENNKEYDRLSVKLTQTNHKPEDFEKLELIGKGFYGKVYLVKNKLDGNLYAMKCLKKSKLIENKDMEHIGYEQRVLSSVDHPFIVKLISLFQDESKIYILTEYYSGGELFHKLRKYEYFSEEITKFYFAQILLAIEFLHNKKIIYRDLKPENILIDNNGYLKLADFGLSKNNFDDNNQTNTFCGTNEYMAPEIILGEAYSKPVDVWCLGILLYEMSYGIPPFYDSNKDKLYKKILFSDPDYYLVKIKISDETKNLISCLLDKNPKTRININKIRNHNYFKNFDFQSLLNKNMMVPRTDDTRSLDLVGSNPSTHCSEINSKEDYNL